MADLGFDPLPQLPKRLPILGDPEEGVVPKTVATAGFEGDPPFAYPFNDLHRARSVGKGECAPKAGRSLIEGGVFQRLEELLVILRIARIGAGVPGRMDARFSVQEIDLQPRIVGEGPLAGMPRHKGRFLYRILFECRPVLRSCWAVGEVLECPNAIREILDQLFQLFRFMKISGCENKILQ